MTVVAEERGLRLRRAVAADEPFLARLAASEEVEPFMSASAARTEEALAGEVRRSLESPQTRVAS